METFKKTALKAAELSAKKLINIYNNFERSSIKMKSSHEIITSADLLSEKIIISEIKKNFPKHHILSEETGDNNKKSDYLWIIDPIDGTTNFSMKNPLWAISIALAYKNEIILGVVFAPILKEVYVAQKNKGSFLNNKKIKVSKIKGEKVLNTFCHGSKTENIKKAIKYYNKQKLNNFDCRQLGSASIELAYVACGRIESITIPGAHSWDVAAGALIVKEANGKVSDFKNKNWDLSSKDIIASNGLVHQQIIDTVKNL
ncbi:inositol monophosphatase [Candidatus Falkowbacteria bacterium HGW-Falkowbacteria-1]|uniref:Inositol-1-monophosphatase n=1 Tax=Candidatus Falkowbacteria bacterium HGW-Falkowbacteria-1 TaxID=2013768 RepID=A0A2N2EA62_9BACT|nr:MAG: inositol monophosphatase [Candidatus Falkowbacteria bacterium HGW-Falkowbacteria-1]